MITVSYFSSLAKSLILTTLPHNVACLDTWRIPEELLHVKSRMLSFERSLWRSPNLLPKTFCHSAKFKVRSDCLGQCPGKVCPRTCLLRCVFGHLFQCMTTLIVIFYFSYWKNTFLTKTILAATWICCSLFCHMHLWEATGPSSMSSPREQLKRAVISHHWQLLQRLGASPPLFTLHVLQPLPYPGVLHLTPSCMAKSFSYWVALNCTQHSKCGLTVQKREEDPISFTCWPHFYQDSPVCSWLPCCQAQSFPGGTLSTELLRALSILSSKSPINILNHHSPDISPWRMPLVSDLPAGLLMAEHNPLRLAVLPIFHLIIHPLIQALFYQLGLGHFMENCVKNVLEVKINNIHYSALIQSQ